MVVPSSNTFSLRDFFLFLVIIAGSISTLCSGYDDWQQTGTNENRALSLQQLQSFHERKQWSSQDYGSGSILPPPADKPSSYQKAFELKEECATNCLSHCYPIYFTDDNTIYICTQLKPPSDDESNWPWILILIVICGLSVFCLVFLIWKRKKPSSEVKLDGRVRISSGSKNVIVV